MNANVETTETAATVMAAGETVAPETTKASKRARAKARAKAIELAPKKNAAKKYASATAKARQCQLYECAAFPFRIFWRIA
jgi:hypothetical protein